ncbi:OPT oligopeptide transporter protein-domain-containing protein [Rhypophila decipiens]|uniref:OPT oligopeptide transporter protein-domain-containing protein n=1 Tax=Rhypophila decipiens TaxID=261697 RepID=A0AAN6YFT1_9PEZI|nr:OPT oligopeptide transporter protein-domain-containing protein [Rhypophila decipiens]
MPSNRGRRDQSPSTPLPLPSDLQAVPLRPLEPVAPTQNRDPVTGARFSAISSTSSYFVADLSSALERRVETSNSPASLPLERLGSAERRTADPHGRPRQQIEPPETTTNAAVSESLTDSLGENAHTSEHMPKKGPFLLGSTAAPSGPSYGAISPSPGSAGRPSTSSTTHSEPNAESEMRERRRRSSVGSNLRRDRSLSVTRAASRRQSEELGGSTVIGGPEGRFGTTETPLLNDPSDIKLDEVEEEESGEESLEDYSDAENSADEHDPPDNSPYAQVRASVAPTDNTTLSINTPRMWTLSVLFSILGSSTNLFFSLRYPSVAITPVIALLLVHPLGLLWDFALKRHDDPPEEYVDGHRSETTSLRSPTIQPQHVKPWRQRSILDKLRLWLAQGRWNEKEHSCVYVSSNVSFGFAFATDVIVEQTQFYKQEATIPYQLLLTLSTQILGYTFAGLTRRFLVRPSGMIWPGTLMSAAMFTTLHKEENTVANGWRISRWNFFYIVWFATFVFYFLPGLFFPALSYFNVVTWFAPDNVVLANLFGVVSGLGLFPLTFDWAQVAYIGSPLLTPFWAAMNVVGGLVVVMWIIAPIAYYSNWLYSAYMPILSAAVFDNTGHVYDVSKVLTADFMFDREAYSKYSRVFLPITYVLSYAVQFAGLASLLTHTACWHGKDIWTQWTKSLEEVRDQPVADAAAAASTAYQPVSDGNEQSPSRRERQNSSTPINIRRSSSSIEGLMNREDVHNRLMRRYKDAPMTWYLLTFVSMTAIGIYVVESYPVHLPWYGLLLALGICSILFVPIGIIMAVTNQHSSIYLICQLVAGVLFPGRPVANMVFVTYGYISSAQGIKFAADLKLGHYMKIPPRILFSVQMVATIVSSVTQIAVLNWMFVNVPGICTPQALNGFTCPIARVHFNGSILWGVVGPSEFFGPNATYRPLVWAFALGAVLPIPLWLYARKKRNSIVRKINLPVLFGSLSWIPPATGLNFSVWAVVCYFFNHLIKKRAPAWWAKYTMTLSAALDSGLAFGIVVVFFGFIYPGWGWVVDFKWWGTEVYKKGCDWTACSYLGLQEGQRFGPETW